MMDSTRAARPREDGLDLRGCVRIVTQQYRTIAGVAVIAALVGFIASFAIPKTYEASALVAVTVPEYVLGFDSHFQPPQQTDQSTQLTQQISKSLTSLAMGDQVLSAVLSSASKGLPTNVRTTDDLRRIVRAKAASDPSLIELTARANNPQQASILANAWAQALVTRARAVYGQSAQNLANYEARTQAASTDLTKAQQALTDFQSHNQLNVLTTQLHALEGDQQTYLNDREAVTRLITNVQGLHRHLGEYSPDAQVALGDDLTAILLETKAFDASTSVPIQLQVSDPQSISRMKVQELQAVLANLDSQLSVRSSFDNKRLGEINPQILRLQGQVQQVQNEVDRLTMQRDLAKENYQSLAQQTEGVRLATQGAAEKVKIASGALPPSRPTSPRILLDVAVAGVAGLLLGFSIVFVQEWWRQTDAALVTQSPLPQPSGRPLVAHADGTPDGEYSNTHLNAP